MLLTDDIGIEVISPDLATSTIVGVSCAILVLLFVVQPLGISRLSNGFAPVVIIWLLFNLASGIYVRCHLHSTHNTANNHSRILLYLTTPCSRLSRLTSPVNTLCATVPKGGRVSVAFCCASPVSKPCLRTWVLSAKGRRI